MALADFRSNSADTPMTRRFATGFTYSVSHLLEFVPRFLFFLLLIRVDIIHRVKKIAVVRSKVNCE